MPDLSHRKSELRALLRQRRRSANPEQQRLAAQLIAEHARVLPAWSGASNIALYLDTDGEIGTRHLRDACLKEQKALFLPIVDGPPPRLHFARWKMGDALLPNRYGIEEPAAGAEQRPVHELDIVFMPLVAWDRTGHRLGMGGGYYDRTLAHTDRPVLVGLAYSGQELEEVPSEDWDITLDAVITEAGIQYCNRG